jgi:hypothetical protein
VERQPPRVDGIAIDSWRGYLTAFDGFLAARSQRDPLAALFWRAAMLLELHSDHGSGTTAAGLLRPE